MQKLFSWIILFHSKIISLDTHRPSQCGWTWIVFHPGWGEWLEIRGVINSNSLEHVLDQWESLKWNCGVSFLKLCFKSAPRGGTEHKVQTLLVSNWNCPLQETPRPQNDILPYVGSQSRLEKSPKYFVLTLQIFWFGCGFNTLYQLLYP